MHLYGTLLKGFSKFLTSPTVLPDFLELTLTITAQKQFLPIAVHSQVQLHAMNSLHGSHTTKNISNFLKVATGFFFF
jgi:hypothetical protein